MLTESGDGISKQADLEDLLRSAVQWPRNIRYATLTSSTQIRVLLVHYDVSPRRLEGTLGVIDLNHSPQYDALSYCWGHPSGRRKIIYINDEAVVIGSSLYSFLRKFGSGARGPIWVDALCINQNDVQERNQQVTMMHKIYRRAREVCMWLGKGDSDTEFALRCCQRWHLIQRLEEEDRSKIIKKIALSLPHVATRAYWNRLWIVQEVALASLRSLVCGDVTVSLEQFYSFLKDVVEITRDTNITDASSEDKNTHVISRPSQRLIGTLESIEQARREPQLLLKVASAFATHQCTDPLDKLYGIRSLADNSQQLVVDYKKSFPDVLLDALEIDWQCFLDDPLKHNSSDISGPQMMAHNWFYYTSWAQTVLHGSDSDVKDLLRTRLLSKKFGTRPLPFYVGAPAKLTKEDLLSGGFSCVNSKSKPRPGDICINLSITHDGRYYPPTYCYLIIRYSGNAKNGRIEIIGTWQVRDHRGLDYYEQHLIHLIISRELQFCQTSILPELRPSSTGFDSVYSGHALNLHPSRRAILLTLIGKDLMPMYGEPLMRAWWFSEGVDSEKVPDYCQCKE